MEWSQWMTDYYRDNMEDMIRTSLGKYGVPAEIHKEKVTAGGKTAEFYQCVCGEEGQFYDGLFFEDIKLISEGIEELETEELIDSLCEGIANQYHYTEVNREKLFDKDITQYLFPVLMNTGLHRCLLNEMPHEERGEISVALHLAIVTGEESGHDIPVTNSMLESWEMTFQEALEQALHNSWFIKQCNVFSNADMLRMINQQIDKEWCGLFQISEEDTQKAYNIYGKFIRPEAVLLCPDFADMMHEKMEGDFLVAFMGANEVQIFQDHGNLEDIGFEIEFANERHGFFCYISDQIYSYSKERGLEPFTDPDKAKLRNDSISIPQR